MRRCTDILPSVIALAMLSISVGSMRAADDPLPSWNDGPARQAIVAFVAKNWSWPRTRS